MTNIYIDNYNFTNDVKELPVIDENIPEWGQVEDAILNETLSIDLPIKFETFFTTKALQSFVVDVIIDDKTAFHGFIDKIDYTKNRLLISCKSKTSVLFNGYIQQPDYAYVIDDSLPMEIIRDILELANLELNSTAEANELSIERALDLRFNATADKLSYVEILEKLMEACCGILYMKNNEFRFEMFNPYKTPSAIEIEESDWIEYPKIETTSGYASVYNGTDVRFGNDMLLKGIENPTKLIDISIQSLIYTYRIDVANYICDLYEYIGTHKKQKLSGKLKNGYKQLLTKSSAIKWNGIIYEMVNISNKSGLGIEIIAEAFI